MDESVATSITLAAISVMVLVAIATATRSRIPLPIPLLAGGLLLGEGGLSLVRPSETHQVFDSLLPFAVAIVVFEGATLLRWKRIDHLRGIIWRLILAGMVVTIAVGWVTGELLLDFNTRTAILFGSLVIVTGPSVVMPLLRAIRVRERVADTLRWEAVLIDPVAVLVTIALFEVLTADDPASPGIVTQTGARLVTGLLGALIGFALLRLLFATLPRGGSWRTIHGMTAIATATAVFGFCEAVRPEAGLVAMVGLGIAVTNSKAIPVKGEDLAELLYPVVLGLLSFIFVGFSASISIPELQRLWPDGLLAALLILFVARPIAVLAASFGSELDWHERAFIAFVAPRGVVAAGLAGVIAIAAGGLVGPRAHLLPAAVFYVIAVSIALEIPLAHLLARYGSLMPPRAVIIGWTDTADAVAGDLALRGYDVTLVDVDDAQAASARELGYEVVKGDAREPTVLEAARVESATAAFVMTRHDDRNLFVAQRLRHLAPEVPIVTLANDRRNLAMLEAVSKGTVVNPAVAVGERLLQWFDDNARDDDEAPDAPDGAPPVILPL